MHDPRNPSLELGMKLILAVPAPSGPPWIHNPVLLIQSVTA